MALTFQLNNPDRWQVQLRRIGTDRNPILIIDDVLANAEEVRRSALDSSFLPGTTKAYYPGFVSPCLPRGTATFATWLARYFCEVVYSLQRETRWKLNFDSLDSGSFFGAFAPDPGARYNNVHVDGHSWLATLIYLSHDSDGPTGTAFWRHKPTGLESFLTDEDSLLRVQKVEAAFGVNILGRLRDAYLYTPEGSYRNVIRTLKGERTSGAFPSESHGCWELLECVPTKFNRLIAYPTWQWHSVYYPDYKPNPTLDKLRLTFNTFVNYPLECFANRVPVSRVAGLDTTYS